ncbi:GIY-YIG nuclease family protein [Robertkochia marina]|uniref:GIY-YIG nuclease family protein n=1 Tax=Robertkochia marina TaxID=1227945 RepID=A0A4S3M2C8_9FLAO|nr:GIY-YIG nuclease family protein [Robertkochia marina]THD69216.1 GIY-YIG nuclease family protein [Robertkochia marina]TRZ47525.1 GIY-YIG nuclease family protein [Robertkochia marina]
MTLTSKFWTVYLLRCEDGSVYKGCTADLSERLQRHQKGEVKYTRTRLPVELITYLVFQDKYKAFQFERYLKTGSGAAFARKRLL